MSAIAGRFRLGAGSMALPGAWPTPIGRTLVVLVSLLYGGVLLLNAMALQAPPRLYVVLAVPHLGEARIVWLRPGSDLWDRGVRTGDAVRSLDGRVPAPRDAGAWMGRRLAVRLGTGRTILVDAATLEQGHLSWPLLVLSPWFYLLGLLVFLRASPPAAARATYALFASAAYALALAPAADMDEPAAGMIEFAAVTLFAALFALFFLTFPVARSTPRRFAALLALPILTIALDVGALACPPLYDVAALFRLGILLVYLMLGAGLLVYSYLTAPAQETRRGLTILSAGTVVAILPFVTLYLLPTLLGRPPILASEQAALALALLPASFAYAILRHGVLDVRLLQRWLVHGLLWVALVAVWAGAVYALHGVLYGLPLSAPGWGIASTLLLALLAIILFRPLYDRAQRAADRLVFKDSYDYRASLQGLSRDLSLAGNLDTLGARLPATLRRLMNLDFAALLVQDGHGVRACGAAGTYQEAVLPALVSAAGDARERPRIVPLAYGHRRVLLLPLHTHGAVVGHLCLGPKASGEPFRPEDHALLATLSGHLAAIVRNAQLVDDLRAKVATLETQRAALDALNERLLRAQEEERARLATDLHDEPLQTAIDLQRQLAGDGAHGVAAHHIALAQTLIGQLRALCTAMRPAALDHLGLHAALDQLANEGSRRAGVPILLDADPEIAELELPPAAQLVLYRATQEALTNCLRHARPRAIQISLERTEGGARLRVVDDGAGFVVPAGFDTLVQEGHLGLAGLHERVQHVGGRLRVTSAPREGTMVQVDLPMSAVTA